MRHGVTALLAALLIELSTSPAPAQEREKRVRKDLEDFRARTRWIYNDLAAGFAEAAKTKKPLLVVLRCIPCEACRGFDEQVAGEDARVKDILDRFVCVRIPQTNGLDLSLFQFDYDLSAYAFFLNADRTIYGRFGTRSTQEDKVGDVSVDAFREALLAALKLHEKYPEVKDSLRAKTGAAPAIKVPEELPGLKGKYTAKLDYQGKVDKSCIHCHQIREVERKELRTAKQPITDKVLHPWPLPDVFGLHLDPRKRATAASVDADSTAARAGFKAGDELLALEGQPLVSIADVQWVLHHAGEEGELKAQVRRGNEELTVKLPLERGWRQRSTISWRATTWDLRRMGTGGLLLKDLTVEEREKAKLGNDALGLRVEHAGEYGDHATAKNAGVKKGDIIVAVDGKSAPMTETDLIAYAVQSKQPGEKIELTVLRGGERKTVSFKVQ